MPLFPYARIPQLTQNRPRLGQGRVHLLLLAWLEPGLQIRMMGVRVGETSATSFTDTLVEREREYCYKVQAYNEGGIWTKNQVGFRFSWK